MRKMAQDFDMDPTSMTTIVKTDLKFSPLKLKKHQYLTVLQQKNRAERSGLLWNLLKSSTQKGEIVFSDEKILLDKVQSTKQQSASPKLRGRL